MAVAIQGNRPSRFMKRMKKNAVSRYGHVARALLLADVLDGELVAHEEHQHLEEVLTWAVGHGLVRVPVRPEGEQQHHEHRADEHPEGVLGEADVEAAPSESFRGLLGAGRAGAALNGMRHTGKWMMNSLSESGT